MECVKLLKISTAQCTKNTDIQGRSKTSYTAIYDVLPAKGHTLEVCGRGCRKPEVPQFEPLAGIKIAGVRGSPLYTCDKDHKNFVVLSLSLNDNLDCISNYFLSSKVIVCLVAATVLGSYVSQI